MRKIMFAVIGLWLMAGSVAVAQEDPGLARRQTLADRYIELSLGDNVQKSFDDYVGKMIEELDDDQGPEAEWMRANLPNLVTRMIDDMAGQMAPIYARSMTEEELTALVGFYETPIGRSIARKTVALAIETQPIMDAAVATYMQEFVTEFCAALSCDDPAVDPGAAKNRQGS